MHVVSTAGHVDHGKSTLIERLTGIDPDRLAEEKARGLTIDLGFAWLTLPSGREVGIVDVPGHERFVHNMLAGVGSVDASIFVVAANEGWMPQSEEHLAILDLLGARRAIVALTKADLVDDGALAAVRDAVAGRLAGTALADAPIVPCSPVSGMGIAELVATLDGMLAQADEGPGDRPRVFIDRSFSVKGAGTVVTGTLTGGALRIGDEVLVLPQGHRARIRGIQTHKRARDEAQPVARVALNLSGLERADLRRGDAVVAPGQWEPTAVLDVELRAVRSLDHDLTGRGAFKAYVGSAETDARLSLYGARMLKAGGRAFARLHLADPVVAAPFDRVIVRDTGRRTTVAGGVVLDAHPLPLRGWARTRRPAQLEERARASRDDIASLVVAERGVVPLASLAVVAGTAQPPRDAVLLRTYALSKERFDTLIAQLAETLAAFHEREPLQRGMPREALRSSTHLDDARLFAELLEAAADRIAADGPLVRLARHRVALSPDQERARSALLAELVAARFSPPSFGELQQRYGDRIVRALVDAGDLVKVSDDVVFAAAQLDAAKRLIADAISREGPLTAARIKDELGTTRKYVIPLLEYLDASGFTRRRGDVREVAS